MSGSCCAYWKWMPGKNPVGTQWEFLWDRIPPQKSLRKWCWCSFRNYIPYQKTLGSALGRESWPCRTRVGSWWSCFCGSAGLATREYLGTPGSGGWCGQKPARSWTQWSPGSQGPKSSVAFSQCLHSFLHWWSSSDKIGKIFQMSASAQLCPLPQSRLSRQ